MNDVRLKETVKNTPQVTDIVPPPVKEDKLPELAELIADRKARLELIRYLTQERQYAEAEAAAKKARRPLSDKIKSTLGTYKISRATWDDWNISYYGQERNSVSESAMVTALLTLGLKSEDIAQVRKACVKISTSYTLRITKAGEKEDFGE
jgi:hypothetical protein